MEGIEISTINGTSQTEDAANGNGARLNKEKKRKQRAFEGNPQESPSKQKKKSKHSGQVSTEHDGTSSPIKHSPFHRQTSSLYLPLSPIGQLHPLRTLCAEYISPLLLTYYQPLHGVILSYSNPRLSASAEDATSTDGRQKVYARSIDEYAAPFVWVTADYLILNPQRGDTCEGYISIQNESSIGLICWNFFSASIERKRLPKDWSWVSGEKPRKWKQKLKQPSQEDDMDIDDDADDDNEKAKEVPSSTFEHSEGYYVNGSGEKVSGLIQFRVKDVDTSGSTSRDFDFMSIIGTMLESDEERRLRKDEIAQYLGNPRGEQASRGRRASSGGQINGFDGAMDSDGQRSSRHRVSY